MHSELSTHSLRFHQLRVRSPQCGRGAGAAGEAEEALLAQLVVERGAQLTKRLAASHALAARHPRLHAHPTATHSPSRLFGFQHHQRRRVHLPHSVRACKLTGRKETEWIRTVDPWVKATRSTYRAVEAGRRGGSGVGGGVGGNAGGWRLAQQLSHVVRVVHAHHLQRRPKRRREQRRRRRRRQLCGSGGAVKRLRGNSRGGRFGGAGGLLLRASHGVARSIGATVLVHSNPIP